MNIRELKVEDIERCLCLWNGCEGICLDSDVDCKEKIGLYLHRNPGLSFAAYVNGELAGTVLCGQDARRGYLQHLAVAKQYRRRGIGKTLVHKVLSELRRRGLYKCNIFVLAENAGALSFWECIGWVEQNKIKYLSYAIVP